MKINLELYLLSKTAVFLNYWDSEHGDDVCCEVRRGKLFLSRPGKPTKRITLAEFVSMVRRRFTEEDADG